MHQRPHVCIVRLKAAATRRLPDLWDHPFVMTTASSTYSTCAFDAAFHTVSGPSYSWTKAWDTYGDAWIGDMNALQQLFGKSGASGFASLVAST